MVQWTDRPAELPKIDAEKRDDLCDLYDVLDRIREAAGRAQQTLDDVEEQYREIDSAQRAVFDWENGHDERVQELEDLDHKAKKRIEYLENIEATIQPRLDMLEPKELLLQQRELVIAQTEEKHAVFGKHLTEREEQLDAREQQLEEREEAEKVRVAALEHDLNQQANLELQKLHKFFQDEVKSILLDLELDAEPHAIAEALRAKYKLNEPVW